MPTPLCGDQQQGQFSGGGDAKLAQGAGAVALDGAHRRAEGLCDFLVLATGGDEAGDLPFAFGEGFQTGVRLASPWGWYRGPRA